MSWNKCVFVTSKYPITIHQYCISLTGRLLVPVFTLKWTIQLHKLRCLTLLLSFVLIDVLNLKLITRNDKVDLRLLLAVPDMIFKQTLQQFIGNLDLEYNNKVVVVACGDKGFLRNVHIPAVQTNCWKHRLMAHDLLQNYNDNGNHKILHNHKIPYQNVFIAHTGTQYFEIFTAYFIHVVISLIVLIFLSCKLSHRGKLIITIS